MKFKKKMICMIFMLAWAGVHYAGTVDSSYEVATWQGFRSCAVTFTFDDNTTNQISVMLPIFDKYGYKMTFYPVINWSPNWTALNTAAQNGHEIGSHTVTHSNLSSMSNAVETGEYKDSQDMINSKITAQKCLTIAYPYCAVGNASLCSQYFVAGRICSGTIVSKNPSDFMNISSIVCGSQGSVQRTTDFTGKAKSALSSHGWAVFLIHAIDSESGYSPTSSSEVDGALQYFSENDSDYWVSTFSNVARYIKERKSASVTEISVEDTMITCTLTDDLDDAIYNYPITIRRILPEEWASARVIQNGKTIDSEIVSANDLNYVMFDVVPDSGDIQIIGEGFTGISRQSDIRVSSPSLLQNYPNPFNPVTTINYEIPESGFVSLKVYDTSGREIETLINGRLAAGHYSTKFDASHLPGGVYVYQLNTETYSDSGKLILLK